MKISAKWLVALMAGSMAFGVVGCKGEPPEPPKAVGEVSVAQNGAEVSIVGFELAKPEFIDQDKNVLRPVTNPEVAVLRIKIRNTSDSEIKYKPLHYATGIGRIQICTDPAPDAEKDERLFVSAIMLNSAKGIQTVKQHIESNVAIPAGGEIVDEYLFEPPTANDKLVALIPGDIVGVPKNMRFYLDDPVTVEPPAPAGIGTPVNVDGVKVTVDKVIQEYAELEPVTPPKTPLKYPYAYTKRPVMSVYVTINNTSANSYSYAPSHNVEQTGISMKLPGDVQLKRVKVSSGAKGKGQVQGIVALAPDSTITDVYYFEPPASNSPVEFMLAGKVFGVMGAYRYSFDYVPSNPPAPDLEPYKNDSGEN